MNEIFEKKGELGLEELVVPMSGGDDLFQMLYCEALRKASEAPRLKPIEKARFNGMLGEELGRCGASVRGEEVAHVED